MRVPLPVRLAALAALVAAPLASTAQPVGGGTVLDGISAIVGGEIVLRSEVDALAVQAAQSDGSEVTPDLLSQALESLVRQRVLVVHAQRDTTLQVQPDYVEQQLDAQIAQLAAQAGGVEALEAYYRRTTDEIKNLFRDDVRQQILADQFRARRVFGVTVTPTEVREWFEQIPADERPMVPELVRVAHIVKIPSPTEASTQAARSFAEALRDSIVAEQATIEDLARRHSDDPGSARRGGLIENIRLNLLVPSFAAVAGSIEPGDISPVFESPFGYHVLRVNEREGTTVTFNHVLVAPQGGEEAEAAARDALVAIRDSVQAGQIAFETAARRNSDDAQTSAAGGYVSDPRTGDRDLRIAALGPQWQATLSGMAVGDLSEPAPIRLLDATGTEALHIVLLQKRTPEHVLSIADDYALLSQYALNDKRQRVFETWVQRLQEEVYVVVRDPRYTGTLPTES